MPVAPPTACRCGRTHCYCRRKQRQAYDQRRGTAARRGYDSWWRKARTVFLAEHPLCSDPFGRHGGRPVAASVVDHIIPHRGDQGLFRDPDNWQALCKLCHDIDKQRSELKRVAVSGGGSNLYESRSKTGAPPSLACLQNEESK